MVRRELQALGIESRVEVPGRIAFQGTWTDVCRANRWLRCADRVLVKLLQFDASDFDQLFETTKAFDWSEWLVPNGCFPVVGKTRHSQLTSLPAIQRSTKKAIVESLRRDWPESALEETGATYKIEVALLKDVATITMDTTGSSLHKRGYRKLTAAAPLKETLATAMVQLSFWRPGRPLIDPFCGSGTIPIEAAMIGANMAPGRHREFSCTHWQTIDGEAWKEADMEADDLLDREAWEWIKDQRIIGTDRDSNVLSLARFHAENAKVAELIHWQQKDFSEILSKRTYGCVITNPPYGERLQSRSETKDLYRSMPGVLQRLPTWSSFILTSFPGFEKVIQKSADRRRKLYNGRLECTFYQFHGPRPSKGEVAETEVVDAGAAFGNLSEKADEQAELLAARLTKRARHLRKWPSRGITCFRLYEKDIPEIPLVIDRYEDCLHVTEYERPHDRDLGQQAAWLGKMVASASKTLEIPRKKIFLKSRVRNESVSQLGKVSEKGERTEVVEGGLKFLVNLSDYIDTGLFLDHRQTRSMVRDEAEGKNVLNLFAYTGSFSVYAASGKAKSTTTVDWSSTYLDWARQNFSINGLDRDSNHFVRSDAMEYVKSLPPKPCFDLAIVDPPTFSNSKRTNSDWDTQRDHVELLNALLIRMSGTSVIYFSTNFRRFKIDEDAINANKLISISRQTVPEDFRNKRIHRCWKIFK